MTKLLVALRWNGGRQTRQQLLDRANRACASVAQAFTQLDHLDVQAVPDEGGQYVQLIVQTSGTEAEGERMRAMFKAEFEQENSQPDAAAPAATTHNPETGQSEFAQYHRPDEPGFLQATVLRQWELNALTSYPMFATIRQSLGTFLFLLAANAILRLVLLGRMSPQIRVGIGTELGGFVLVGILAAVTFFVPRWWLLVAVAIAIPFFALGIITGIMAVVFLCMAPALRRANMDFHLSMWQYDAIKQKLSSIAQGADASEWPVVAKRGNVAFRGCLFENYAVFLFGNTVMNLIAAEDAGKIIFDLDKAGARTLKTWPTRPKGKLVHPDLVLSEESFARLEKWVSGKVLAPIAGNLSAQELSKTIVPFHTVAAPEPAAPKAKADAIVPHEKPAGTGACEHCEQSFGPLASLGFQIGGYRCGKCGKKSCDACCYRKAKAVGRATMICPACGSEQTQVFVA